VRRLDFDPAVGQRMMHDPAAGGGDTEVAMVTDGLTNKQRVFVEAYLQTWNASEAARQANYAHPGQQGERLLKKVEVAAAIEQRVKAMAMQADEVLARLAEQARANAGDFVVFRDVPVWQVLGLKPPERPPDEDLDDDDEEPPAEVPTIRVMEIDADMIKARGHLVKKISMTKYGPAIELHDGQAALVHIGKHLKLFTEQVEARVETVQMTREEWQAQRAARRAQALQAAELIDTEGADE
jgi:hypothetical protein